MNVFIGCEYSGIVRDAFIREGHTAISCDILPTESIGPHYTGDIFDFLNSEWRNFDIGIFHPPCTNLCVSGNRWYANSAERKIAILWTEMLWKIAINHCKSMCFENPVGVLSSQSSLGKATQYIQPWQFGHGETKKTGLWLHNLPKLQSTNIVDGRANRIHKMAPGKHRGKERSRFYTGIANAMAEQWGNL